MASSLTRNPGALFGLANLFAIGGSTLYLRSQLIFNHEESEARLDEIEGTLRGHIGLIEESLDRIEGKAGEAGKKTAEIYGTRARDEKDGKGKNKGKA